MSQVNFNGTTVKAAQDSEFIAETSAGIAGNTTISTVNISSGHSVTFTAVENEIIYITYNGAASVTGATSAFRMFYRLDGGSDITIMSKSLQDNFTENVAIPPHPVGPLTAGSHTIVLRVIRLGGTDCLLYGTTDGRAPNLLTIMRK